MGRVRERALLEIDQCQITLVFDPYADLNGVEYKIAASADEVIKSPNVDAVFVCLPNHLNFETTKKALINGKHVFCEKPPAFKVSEVQEIMKLEEQQAKVLMYGFNHRHHGAVQKMKSIVDSGDYGKVLWMRGRYGKSVDASYFETWRADKDSAGGGILIDQGIHMLDLFNHIGGGFDEVHSFVSSLYWQLEGVEDNVFAIFRNNSTGLVASLHSTMTQWRHLFSLEVFLEAGYLVLNGLKTESGTYGEEVLTIAKNRSKAPAATWDDEERIRFEVDTSWNSEVEHFIDSIVSDKAVAVGTSRDALDVMSLVEEIYSNETKLSENLSKDLKQAKSP